MAQHFKEICRPCGAIINQCRCPGPNKLITYGVCRACTTKLQKVVTKRVRAERRGSL